MPERLPIILLTGFLGAGKTTLLLRWLNQSPATGRRLGVVMNEFGLESVDSQILQRPGLPLEQVSGGCICCAGDDQIASAINRLVKSGVADFLVVETSGLADPDNVIDVLTDPDLLPLVRLHAVVTVVDGRWYARPESGAGERVLVRKQVQFAHVLCLSKSDLISDVERESVTADLRRLNPRAPIVRLPFGLPELGPILDQPAAEFEIALSESSEPAADGAEGADESSGQQVHTHQQYESVTWRIPVPISRTRFEEFLSRLDSREVVRAKGFVRFTGQPEKLFLFQSVFGMYVIDECPGRLEPVVVMIGPNLDVAKYQAELRSMAFGSARATISLQ